MSYRETTVLFFWDMPERLRTYITTKLSNLNNLKLIFPNPANEEEYLKIIPSVNVLYNIQSEMWANF